MSSRIVRLAWICWSIGAAACSYPRPGRAPESAGTGGAGGSAGDAGGTTAVVGGGGAGKDAGDGGLADGGGPASDTGPVAPPNPNNLITNGDFSNGMAGWHLTGVSTDSGMVSVANGQLCVVINPAEEVSIGWPSDATMSTSLAAGAGYQLSYEMTSTLTDGTTPAALTLEIKLGQAVAPYAPDLDITTDVPTAEPMTFSHAFVARTADPQAGVVFNVITGNLFARFCMGAVTLIETTAAPGDAGATADH